MKCKQTETERINRAKSGFLEKSYKLDDKSLTKLIKKQGAGADVRNEDDILIYYTNVKEIARGHYWLYTWHGS